MTVCSIKIGELKAIEEQYHALGIDRCKAELFERYKATTEPTWEGIANAVEKMPNKTLAKRLRNKIHTTCTTVVCLTPTVYSSTCSPTSPSQHISVEKVTVKNFCSINVRFSSLVANIKDALRKEIPATHLQDFLQECCGLPFLPLQALTMEAVLNRMSDYYSLFEHEVLQAIVDNYFRKSEIKQEFDSFEKEFEDFQNSATLEDIITKIKERSKLTIGYSEIEIKLCGLWRKVTIKKFIEFVAAVGKDRRINDLTVMDGCVHVQWQSMDFMPYPISHSLKLVGIIYIKENGRMIYEADQPIDDSLSLDTALLNAVEGNSAEAIELLLTIGGNPYLLIPSSGQTVLNIATKIKNKHGVTVLYVACQYGHCDTVRMLLAAGSDPKTVLMKASSKGHTKVVKSLLSTNAITDQNLLDRALLVASSKGHTKVAQLILSANYVNLEKVAQDALVRACSNGHVKVAQLLLPLVSEPNTKDMFDMTALMSASSNGHVETVELLLSADIDVSIRGIYNKTALMMASSNGHAEIVDLLLSADADPNERDNDKMTSLMMASYSGHVQVAELLLLANANPNLRDKNNRNALMIAALHGHADIVKLLITANVIINLNDNDEMTALMMASSNGHNEVVKLLLSADANPNMTDAYNMTALMMASSNGHTEVVNLLLSAGADPNIQQTGEYEGTTALYSACEKGHDKIVFSLLKAGADANLSKSNGWTPLFIACTDSRISHMPVIESLLDNAEVNQSSENGCTPLVIACQYGNANAVKLLIQYGADIETALSFSGSMITHEKGYLEMVELAIAYVELDTCSSGYATDFDAASTCSSDYDHVDVNDVEIKSYALSDINDEQTNLQTTVT